MKAKHPDAILLSRVGDFYEAYGDDAETIARALSIALTSKEAGGGTADRDGRRAAPRARRLPREAGAAAARRGARRAARSAGPQQAGAARRRARRHARDGDRRADARARRAHLPGRGLRARRRRRRSRTPTFRPGTSRRRRSPARSAFDDVLAEIARLDPAEIVADVPPTRARRSSGRSRTRARGSSRRRSPPSRRRRPRRSTASRTTSRSRCAARSIRSARSCGGSASRRGTGEAFRPPQYLLADRVSRARRELAQAPRAAPGARQQREGDAAGDDRPLAHRDGIAAAGALALGAAGRRATGSRRAPTASRRSCATPGAAARSQDVLHACFDLERIAQKIRFRRALPRDLASLRRTLALLDPIGDALAGSALPPLLRDLVAQLDGFDDAARGSRRDLVDEPPATLADGGVIRPEALAGPGRMRRAARRRALAPQRARGTRTRAHRHQAA